MDRAPPSWLDEKFLTSVLQGGEDDADPVKIIEFSAVSAVPPGTNYLSHLFRVRVRFTRGGEGETSEALIVKAPLTTGIITEMGDHFTIHKAETLAYKELLPLMNKISKNDFGPKSFYCPIEKGFVLKDLTVEGYIMCDRFKQLDYAHCKEALVTLAKFHATSVACRHENPGLVDEVSEEKMFKEGGPLEEQMKTWLQSTVCLVGNIVKEIDGCEAAADLIFSRAEGMADSINRLCKKKEVGLNVLNHGDLWCNNMMFKHNDSGDIMNVKLIDFQVMRWTSPVMDLLYFIWTSANEDVRENRQRDLFDIYLETLNSTLEEISCDERLPREELWTDLKAATNWIILIVSNTLPMMICEVKDVMNTEEMSMEDFKSGDTDKANEMYQKMHNGKFYRALLPGLMKQLAAWAET